MDRQDSSQRFWTRPVGEVLEHVGGSPGGLTTAEAAGRLKRWGPNEVAPPRRFEAVREIARYLANPLVLILGTRGNLLKVSRGTRVALPTAGDNSHRMKGGRS